MKHFIIALTILSAPLVFAEEVNFSKLKSLEKRVAEIEREQSNLDREVSSETRSIERRLTELEDNAATGIGLLGSGILCALWAQFTRRSGWLWFFFGLILAPIALIAMVWKNSDGLASGELRYWTRE